MFEVVSAELGRAIDELEIPVERRALVQCFSLLDRFSAKLAGVVAAFDSAEAWRDDGATSMTAWQLFAEAEGDLVPRLARRRGGEGSTAARSGRRRARRFHRAAAEPAPLRDPRRAG